MDCNISMFNRKFNYILYSTFLYFYVDETCLLYTQRLVYMPKTHFFRFIALCAYTIMYNH